MDDAILAPLGAREIGLDALYSRKKPSSKKPGWYYNPEFDEIGLSVSGICIWRLDDAGIAKYIQTSYGAPWISDWDWKNWFWLSYEDFGFPDSRILSGEEKK